MNQRKELTEFLANLSKGDFANAQTSLSLAIEGKVKERMASIMKEDNKKKLNENYIKSFSRFTNIPIPGSGKLIPKRSSLRGESGIALYQRNNFITFLSNDEYSQHSNDIGVFNSNEHDEEMKVIKTKQI
jgi:hypothetical protein